MSEQTTAITDAEVHALVRRAFDNVLRDAVDRGWFDWEQVPELGEYDWGRVVEAFELRVVSLSQSHDILDELAEVDRRELWGRFQ